MKTLWNTLRRLSRLFPNRLLSCSYAESSVGETNRNSERKGPQTRRDLPASVEVAAAFRVLKVLSGQLTRTAEDLEHSVLNVSTGFGGMAQKARDAVERSQCRIESQTVMHQVLETAGQTLLRVDTISKEARMVGLNGQIEAARAGVQGTAFSVVANETKALAAHASETSQSLKSTLRELSQLHQGLVDALQSAEVVSKDLTGDIAKAVMGLQFQDRINQQIMHIVEALDVIHDNVATTTSTADSSLVEERTGEWCEWLQRRSTMESERAVLYSSAAGSQFAGQSNSDFGSVELF